MKIGWVRVSFSFLLFLQTGLLSESTVYAEVAPLNKLGTASRQDLESYSQYKKGDLILYVSETGQTMVAPFIGAKTYENGDIQIIVGEPRQAQKGEVVGAGSSSNGKASSKPAQKGKSSESSKGNDGASGPGLGIDTGAVVGGAISGALSGVVGGIIEQAAAGDPEKRAQVDAARERARKSSEDLAQARGEVANTWNSGLAKNNEILGQILSEKAAGSGTEGQGTGGEGNPDFNKMTDPALRAQGERLWKKLDGADPESQQQAEAQEFGKVLIIGAAELSAEGDNESANMALKIASDCTQFVLGLNPAMSLAMDYYSLIYAKDIMTGEPLSELDRAISGVSFVATVTTAGAYAPLQSFGKLVAKTIPKLKIPSGITIVVQRAADFFERTKLVGGKPFNGRGIKDFSNKVLKGNIRDIVELDKMNRNWTPAMRQSYGKLSRDIDRLLLKDPSLAGTFPSYLRDGMSPEQLRGQYEQAKAALNTLPGFTGNAQKIADHLPLMDLKHKIEIVKFKKGELFHQWTTEKGRVGAYVTRGQVTPSEAGVGAMFKNPVTGLSERLKPQAVYLVQDTLAVRSVAGPGYDLRNSGVQEFDGGAEQIVMGSPNLRPVFVK